MISKVSLCCNCKNRLICKHHDYIFNQIDIEFQINSCESYASKEVASSTPAIINTLTPSTEVRSFPNLNDYMEEEVKTDITVTPVEVVKKKCSICGKKAVLENCSDCGEQICSTCGYTNLNVDTGLPIITCDKCFTGSKDDDGSTSTDAWDITAFENKDKKEKLENEQTNSRKSSKKSKKS